jgi:hypothetical protein
MVIGPFSNGKTDSGFADAVSFVYRTTKLSFSEAIGIGDLAHNPIYGGLEGGA